MAQAAPDKTLLVVYDFDQTISSDHIYHTLDGMAKMRTSKGQVEELNGMLLDEVYELFGGKERVSRLNLHFERVTTLADVAILSFGYVEVIQKSLAKMGLSKYFENALIIGCDSAELKQVHGNKAQCIQNMKKKKNLKSDQVLFVDDDSTNIRKAKNLNACKTIEIKPRNGMTSEHMEEIEKIMGVFEIEKKTKENNENNGNNEKNENLNETNNDSTNNNSNSDNSGNNDNSNNDNNNSSNNDNSNNNSSNDNSNKNNSNSTDDSKEPNTNRQSSWKDKFTISEDNNKLFEKMLGNNEESEGTPVVDVDVNNETDSETNENTEDFVLAAPVMPNGNNKE